MIISAIPFTASISTLSAFPKALDKVRLPNISRSFSLWIISKASTVSFSRSIPCTACFIRKGPSNLNGRVTTATVRSPISLHAFAITGVAPVPVPPPIPATRNTIFVLSDMFSITSSIFSIAACSPISGRLPAPLPSVSVSPIRTFSGTLLRSKACASVLATRKSTS